MPHSYCFPSQGQSPQVLALRSHRDKMDLSQVSFYLGYERPIQSLLVAVATWTLCFQGFAVLVSLCVLSAEASQRLKMPLNWWL